MKSLVVEISGMNCNHCVMSVQKALNTVAGAQVKSVAIGRAEVLVPESGGIDELLRAAVEKAGFDVTGIVAG